MNQIPGYIIAGTNSGCGKTTITLALMAWLSSRGYSVAPFKIGPDFIDPGHHKRVTGRESINLDGWMLNKVYNIETFRQATKKNNADIAIIEGVMGLFDGYSGTSESGSTAEMAKWLNIPVILVINAKSMARSVGAMVQGFENFDPELVFAGVIFNNLGSAGHLTYLTDALKQASTLPCLGGVLRNNAIKIPERHLGLMTDDEYVLHKNQISTLVDTIDNHIDTKTLFSSIQTNKQRGSVRKRNVKGSVRIGIARDKAFCFYYKQNLEILQQHGAELVYFSPITDTTLPTHLSGLYFGGGYPELFAQSLSTNTALQGQIRTLSCQKMPIYAECGGFMYLAKSMKIGGTIEYPMVGCFALNTTMCATLQSLGYREITLTEDTIIGKKGETIRGHEFHYSMISQRDHPLKTVYAMRSKRKSTILQEGYYHHKTLGSYVHLHFGSNPESSKCFIEQCSLYNKKQGKHYET